MPSIADVTGWLATGLVVGAASVPMGHRLLARRRAALTSAPTRWHVGIGFAASAGAFAHVLAILPALGSPAAIGAGMAALAPGAAGFFLLLAHVGVGLRLRDPKLRARPRVRRAHVALAVLISLAVSLHVALLVRPPAS